jgi:hypothetical protein
MTWTSVRLTKQEQAMLIKAAALEKISVEDLASQILSKAIQEMISVEETIEKRSPSPKLNPLAGLKPYAYDATPEESVLPAEEWDVFMSEDD